MRFSTRIFLTSSAVGAAGVLAAAALVSVAAEGLSRRQYNVVYQQRLELAANDFVALEAAYTRVASNAARAVRERLSLSRGKISQGELARLAGELGVRKISIANAKGVFVAASDGVLGENLFSFCADYRGLVTGALAEQQTPLLPERGGSSEIVRYTLLPSADRRQIIDVSVGFAEIGALLQRLVNDESDIEHVVLRSPSRAVLGDVRHDQHNSRVLLPNEDHELSATVPADESECCECRTRGFHPPGGGKAPYTYEFTAEVSLKDLSESLTHLRRRFAAIFVFVLAASLAASFWISRLLSAKVLGVRRAMDEITASGDFSRELPIAARAGGPDGPGGQGSNDEIDALAGHFNRMAASMREAQKAEARASIAAQVAHDIRSPLTSMTLALNQLKEKLAATGAQGAVAEMLSVLSSGVSRVNGIVNRLSGRGQPQEGSEHARPVEAPRLTLVDRLLFDVAQEHALKTPAGLGFKISGFTAIPSVWAVVQTTELQAALSNLLSNAFEALADRTDGTVELACTVDSRALKITIRDDGVGIAPENLKRVFERKFTSGKAAGSGLGLYQAKQAVEWCGGAITIESTLGAGTTVGVSIPIERKPAWLVDRLTLKPGQTLVVVDDDPAVLATWRAKVMAAGPQAVIREFSSMAALDGVLGGGGLAADTVFVLDQYAGDGPGGLTGLKLIEKYNLGPRAVLSTSEFDDAKIQDGVKACRSQMIPKPQLSGVVVSVATG